MTELQIGASGSFWLVLPAPRISQRGWTLIGSTLVSVGLVYLSVSFFWS